MSLYESDGVQWHKINSGGGGGSGIEFDTSPQEGNYLNLIFQGGTTFEGSEPGADGYGGMGIYSDWADTDDNSVLVAISAEMSNPTVGFVTALSITANNSAGGGDGSADAITAFAESDADNGPVTVISATGESTGTGGGLICFSAHTGGFSPNAATAVGLSTEACIFFANAQDETTVAAPGSTGCVLYFRNHSGVLQLVANVAGTITVLAHV